ncbi:MAG TPA: HD domain-containing phosphohydrolase [Candidatus Sulfotelmatobacter sp.]|nr:HD domain-containing phosphohydrolase [Candidatus Sulfotelmatobacter sp.]
MVSLWPLKLRFHISISLLILLIVAAIGTLSMIIVVRETHQAARDTAVHEFKGVSNSVQDRMALLFSHVQHSAAIISQQPQMAPAVTADGTAHPSFALLSSSLTNIANIYSIYVAHADGSFLQVIAAKSDDRVIAAHQAPPHTDLIVRTITADEHGVRRQNWTFLDRHASVLGRRTDDDVSYDPRQRTWYNAALQSDNGALSAPYLFNSLKQPGLTASHKLDGGEGVVGIDLTLKSLDGFLQQLDISPNGGAVLFDEQARIMASTGLPGSLEPLGDMTKLNDYPFKQILAASGMGTSTVDSSEHGPIIVERADWWTDSESVIHLAIYAPEQDFTSRIDLMERNVYILNGLLLVFGLPIVGWMSRGMAKPVVQLAEEAERICAWDFSGDAPKKSFIMEIGALAEGFSIMKQSLMERTRNLERSQASLGQLVDLGIALSAESDSNRLMDMILAGAKKLTNADGGTLYIRDEDKEQLVFRIIKNDSLKIDIGSDGALPSIPAVPLYREDGSENHNNVVSHSVLLGQTTNIADVYQETAFDFSGTRRFDEANRYRTHSVLTVPLIPRGGAPIGAIQLINAQPQDGHHHNAKTPQPFAFGVQRFVQALAALAATALYNRSLLDAQEALVDSMIEIMAGAIDAKSPYTGGHCARVPELALMLAEEACTVQDGPLADFRFATDEEWHEFRIGAFLHDCGKVTTPEYVVDKATKLETIFNRIHEVRTRFEVLWRDAEVRFMQDRLNGVPDAEAQTRFEDTTQRLTDDFNFVAECNVGGEFMAADKIERLKSIAQQTWVRHYDDRIGLSHGELERIGDLPPQPLPATEFLLADKPEHIIPRNGNEGMFDPKHGFRIPIPKHLYNNGEVYNLSISRGTLNDEERFKVNEHAIQTILMLDRLKFPKNLRRVPEYAGTHHETLIGTGYPRKLDAAQLSIPARIMVLADIFEALTAADRPYKKPKTLSEAVKILSFFVKDQHIDGDLFRLFLSSGAYLRYAEKYLKPEQRDEVDVMKYLGAA